MAERDEEARKQALTNFLADRAAHGFRIETRTDTHAIIVRGGRLHGILARFGKTSDDERQVISVDENGVVTARPAEPIRW